MAITDRRSNRDHLRRGRHLFFLLLLIGLAACANKARLQEQAGNHINIGTAYLGSGQYTSAMKELLEAERLTPEDPKVHYLLGISYHGKGLDERAIDEFQRAIALNPEDSVVHNYLGAIYLDRGRLDDAITSFNRALANILYDTPATTLYNLGRAYYAKGLYDAALKHYRDAVSREPDTILMPLIEKEMGSEIHRTCPVTCRIPLWARSVLSKAESGGRSRSCISDGSKNGPRFRIRAEGARTDENHSSLKGVIPGLIPFSPRLFLPAVRSLLDTTAKIP
jgi:tetratricopeptide (TPR) repeat protein